ncbi:hypothetical protein [Solemya velum gill symbiont]|uniref:hypothetical protein n=1 Tax=Solemya velum gill symbiont TaxID=2340 RepID=UPI002118C35C|nr:hypothetical protein [Solemya velum gill symbiont]
MPMLLRKHPLITFIAVVIALLLTWGFWPQPIMVETKPATRSPSLSRRRDAPALSTVMSSPPR